MVSVALVAILVALVVASPTKGWNGRSLSLLDLTYASKYIPIIASVSEHQPPTWPSYFMDINALAFLVPASIIACFLPLSKLSSLVLYLVIAIYFSSVMVRLMLVLGPAAYILSGIALFEGFSILTQSVKHQLLALLGHSLPEKIDALAINLAAGKDVSKAESRDSMSKKGEEPSKEKASKRNKQKDKDNVEKVLDKKKPKKKLLLILPLEALNIGILLLVILGSFYVIHFVWAAAKAYSAPSIVLTSQSHDGLHVFDDFREAYAWLR